MKKIAIVTRKMVAGGIEKSILSMIDALDKKKYQITLFVMATGGEFSEYIPSHVKVKPIYGSEKTTLEKIKNKLKQGKVITAIKVLVYTILSKKVKSVFNRELHYLKIVENQEEEFDIAIADHVPASLPVIYVSECLKAKKRVAWIHSDVSRYKEHLDKYKKYYDKYDRIFSVSKEAKDKFENIYPDLSKKLDIFYNIISKEDLIKQSKSGEGFNDNFDGTRLLTIGRLCNEKGQDIIPQIAKKLKEKGYNFKWYCIGDGEDKQELQQKINEFNLNTEVVLLGNKNNPYRYLKECDIYVQPSRHECYCTTVTEAKCFAKPMVITDVNGSKEQIVNGENGLIVDFDVKQIFKSIEKLLLNDNLRTSFELKLKNNNVDTKNQIYKLIDLLNK